jgi:hypothetical protein
MTMRKQDPDQPTPNVDQELLKRQGDSIANTSMEANDRDRNAPVPEEETFERQPRNQRQR